MDNAAMARANFNSNEFIGFLQKVANTAASSNLIAFTYTVTDPDGKQVFSHSGNSAPGSVTGESASQITGIAVAQIYTRPGTYTLTATAVLDGQTISQKAAFVISSPIITLLYPPNGSQDLIASPLMFSWSGSGASQYRVLVDDDASFYNTLFTGLTAGPETTFSYPENPPDQKQRLASGQIYYWKVEGLDAGGIKVAEAVTPYTFTVKQQTTQSRDIALTSLEKIPNAPTDQVGAIPFRITVKNQGSQTESNIPVNLYVNGAAGRDSPKQIATLSPGEENKVTMVGVPPPEAKVAIVQASIDFYDDNMNNNRINTTINLAQKQKEEPPKPAKTYSCAEIWQIVQKISPNAADLGKELDGYSCEKVEAEGLNDAAIAALVEALQNNKAKIIKAVIAERE